ncbi:MAG: hypothetical protein Q9163_001751 [Psora crenata]
MSNQALGRPGHGLSAIEHKATTRSFIARLDEVIDLLVSARQHLVADTSVLSDIILGSKNNNEDNKGDSGDDDDGSADEALNLVKAITGRVECLRKELKHLLVISQDIESEVEAMKREWE